MKGGMWILILGTAATCACSSGSSHDSSGSTPGTTTNTETTPSPPTTTPPPTAFAIPEGYTVLSARNFGVACDGVMDDTSALQSALNGVKSYQALELPAGTCLYSKVLVLYGKTNVMVVGAGKDATILKAIDPKLSSFVVSNGSTVTLSAFQVYSPSATVRMSDANSRGFYVEKSSQIAIDGVKVRETAGAGIVFWIVQDSKIANSEVHKSRADAFHITGGSQNITVQGNLAVGAGDDGLASIGYGAATNRNISFLDNEVRDGWWGSGVAFEGTIGGKAYRNKIYRSGVAGIRISSHTSYNTLASDYLDLQDNYLEGCVTRTDTGHGSVMIYGQAANLGPNITLARTKIVSPTSGVGVRAFGYLDKGTTVGATVTDSVMSGLTRTFTIGDNATIARSGNTLNGVAVD